MIGRTLAHYRIVGKLGAGGMGEVYRATDTKLGRDVAIKVLPPAFAQDPERLVRFQREAHVLASLNHPNIAAIYGLEESDGAHYLVLELVPGENLTGPQPVEEALRLARHIAEALEEAHEKGVVHRDLKPANVKVTPDGKVKVLDFGLAKAFSADPVSEGLANSPTLTAGHTRAGVILGTAAYMSPEQARGRMVDKRTDIWAFGCILYELLTGRQAFGGESTSDCMAAVLRGDPDWTPLPAPTPPGIRRLLRRCLQKDPKQRLHDIADARFEIDDAALPASPAPTPAASARPRWRWQRLAVAAVLLVLAAFAGGLVERFRAPAPISWHGEILGGSTIALGPRVSPDGHTLAFQALVDGQNQVAVLRPASGDWTVLTHDRTRGLIQDLCWSRDGSKIYFDRYLDVPRGIFSVPVLGGEERLVVEDATWPAALPDGSLVVTRINADRQSQLFRFWPDTQRLQALPALLIANTPIPPARPFADGKEVAFLGRTPAEPEAPDRLYALDLESGRTRRLAPAVESARQVGAVLAAEPLGRYILVDLPAGNLHRIVAVPRDGSGTLATWITLTQQTWFADVGADGSLYLDQIERPAEVLRFPASGGDPERLAVSDNLLYADLAALPFPDGRVLLPSQAAGRDRLLVVTPGKEPVPFLDTPEESSTPATLVGDREVAFLAGPSAGRTIAVASLRDGRMVRRLTGAKGAGITSLAASPDGQTLYYVASGTIWAIPSTDGQPRKIRSGDSLAIDPANGDLIVKLNEKDAVRLVRVPAAGGPEQALAVPKEIHLAPTPLAPTAVGKDGRILTQITTSDSWFWPSAVLDSHTGALTKLPVRYLGDMTMPGWTSDGRVALAGLPLKSNMWRFRPRNSPGSAP